MGGASYHDLRDVAGVSSSSVYRCIDLFLDAVNEAEELDLKFPTTDVEIEEAAARFKAKSTHGVMAGCVGCVDGILIRIIQPSGVDNPRAYYSGHYCSMGLNVQAVCDARLRFTYIAVAGPGKPLKCIH